MSDPTGAQPPYGGQPPYGAPPQPPSGQPPYGAPAPSPYGQPASGAPAPYGPPPTAPAKKSNVGLIIAVVLIFICVLPVGGILGLTLLGRSVTYSPVTSSDGKVSFEMAGTPTRKTSTKSTDAGTFEIEAFSSTSGNDAFLVGTFVLPGLSDADNIGEALDAELNAIAQGDGGTITSRSEASFRGNIARSADVSKGGVSGKCLTFVQGDRVVDVCAWTTGSLQDKYQRLLDSIRVTG